MFGWDKSRNASLSAKIELDISSRFDTIQACEGRTNGHQAIANNEIARICYSYCIPLWCGLSLP